MSEHTKGLTVVQNTNTRYKEIGDCAIVDEEGKIIGEAFVRVGTNMERPALANAQLWAAAPDLHEALQAIHAGFIDGTIRFAKKRHADSDPYHPANILMSAALAKARGTQP